MLLAPLLATLVATQVPEPPSGAAIVWQAPAGCPDRAALERAIAGRLGRAPAEGELALDGRIVKRGRYRLELRLGVGGHTQARTLSARRCAALVDAAALLAALALDPSAAARGPTRAEVESALDDDGASESDDLAAADPAPEVAGDTAPAPEPDLPVAAELVEVAPKVAAASPETEDVPPPATVELVEPAPIAPPPRRPGPGGFVRLAGGLEYGAVPALTGGFALAGGLLWRRARLELHGLGLLPQTAARGDNSVRVSVLAGGVQGCGRLGLRRLEFPLCGGFELGAVRADARGPGARSVGALWSAALLSAAAVWRAHPRLALSLAVQGVLRLAAPSFELRDPGPTVRLFEPAPVSLRLLLGLELRLGDPW